MTQSTQADPTQLVDIGTVAAMNLAIALKLEPSTVPAIRQAIRDEINAMSSHFTLAFADIQANYEHELYKIGSAFSFVKSNKVAVGVTSVALLLVGVLIGLLA